MSRFFASESAARETVSLRVRIQDGIVVNDVGLPTNQKGPKYPHSVPMVSVQGIAMIWFGVDTSDLDTWNLEVTLARFSAGPRFGNNKGRSGPGASAASG